MNTLSELRGFNYKQNSHFQIRMSQDLIHVSSNGFHSEKSHIFFLKPGVPTFGHQTLCWVTYYGQNQNGG